MFSCTSLSSLYKNLFTSVEIYQSLDLMFQGSTNMLYKTAYKQLWTSKKEPEVMFNIYYD